MIQRSELLAHLDELLQPGYFSDYGPNGLQVEGAPEIQKIITGVSICEPLIDAAIAKNAETILVHHGMFWKLEGPRVVGIKKSRLAKLLSHNINLIGYHLPLDAQLEFGNNAQIAKLLNIKIDHTYTKDELLFVGHLEKPMNGKAFEEKIATAFSRKPLYIPAEKEIQIVGWCSGGGADYIHRAIECGVDAFITGEVYERTVPVARESNIHLYGAGHHATERYGIKALGEHLSHHFSISVEFIDIDNPV